MSYSDNEQLYRQIIMDHYQHPRHKGLSKEPGFVNILKNNPSCGDTITVQLKFENGKVTEVHHDGSGCSICCASASMMSDLFTDKTIDDVKYVASQFENMLYIREYDEEAIEEAVALNGVSKLPPRIKCAQLAWQAAIDAVEKYEKEENA